MSQVMIKDEIPREELLTSGHLACPGCGAPVAMRLVLKALGPKTIVTLPAAQDHKRAYDGEHTLQLTIEDLKAKKIGQSSIKFTIKAPGSK